MTGALRGPGMFRGFWSTTAHPAVLEVAASLDPDFVTIDLQHGADGAEVGVGTFTALAYHGVPGLVRVAANDPVHIGKALDLGAAGVIVPMVSTVEEAAAAVAACRYAPDGVRSFGVQTPRVDPFAAERPLCAVQIETAAAVGSVEAIAAVDGVDWLYIGPADLGLSVGGAPADVESVLDGTHPLAAAMRDAFAAVVAAADRHGKVPGIHCNSGAAAVTAAGAGFRASSVATDLVALHRDMATQLATARHG